MVTLESSIASPDWVPAAPSRTGGNTRRTRGIPSYLAGQLVLERVLCVLCDSHTSMPITLERQRRHLWWVERLCPRQIAVHARLRESVLLHQVFDAHPSSPLLAQRGDL